MKNEEDRPLSSAYIDFTIVTRANGSASLHKFRLHVFFLYSALDASAHQSKSILRQKRKQSATDPIYIACQRCVCSIRLVRACTYYLYSARINHTLYVKVQRMEKRERGSECERSQVVAVQYPPKTTCVCRVCSVFEQVDAKLTLNRTKRMPRRMG